MNKSPFNYVGNKYRQLPTLLKIFPKDINCFVDLFTGGGDVITNITAKRKIGIDINKLIIDIIHQFQQMTIEDILTYIDKRIGEFQLSKTNVEGYNTYRELYNNGTLQTPLDLFTLSRFSFNNFIRLNDRLEMNASFGANRSSFNPAMRKNTIVFHQLIQSIQFICEDFRAFDLSTLTKQDFIYADPPYLIAQGVYNNRSKEAWQRWELKDELDLLNYLEKSSVPFALSNLLRYKGRNNEPLIEWIDKHHFNVYQINSDYSHCSYNSIQTTEPTVEIVITNY